ncbi:unnamed protein product [Prorocentrum cordatum]|uniref:Transposase Tc1-like domain-containing protein n=1 Tax=Prorocentrum cordatum TaxID=2364126 RepID=A0ABN9V323_9DINO|nr:unnamed protein product [Polarella glacialis]
MDRRLLAFRKAAGEAANKAANEAAYEAPSEAANEASDEAARGAAKKTAVEATGEAASEAANEVAHEARGSQRGSPRGSQPGSEAVDRAASKATNEATDTAPGKATNEAANETTNEAANETANKAANEAAIEAASKAANRQPSRQATRNQHVAMRRLHDSGMGVKRIAAALSRSTDTVSKHLFKKNTTKKSKGRPKHSIRTPKGFLAAQRAYKKLLKSSGGTKEVTAAMLKSEMKLKCDIKTVRRAFAENGYQFRPLYEKPDLSDGDKKERLQWAREHKHRSPSQWSQYVHACMDNKVFQVLPNAKYRKVAAKRKVRGVYRKRKRDFSVGHVKPSNPKVLGLAQIGDRAAATQRQVLKQSSGKGSVTIACAIGAGKVLMWHQVVGRWNAAAAGRMYSGALQPALKRAYPSVRGKFRVMEDNDPTGYKSRSGMAAKKSAGIQTLDLPKRSPDLMPLDFAYWANLNKRMRGQEKDWPASKTETRAQYLARLRRTALATPSEYIHSIMGSLHKRCGLLVEAKGGHFAEGGGN